MRNHDQALIAAAESGNLRGVQAALAAGADVNARAGHALSRAADNRHLDIVECLLAAGADARTYARPLIWASSAGYLDIVMCLLKAGAKISSTALALAAHNGRIPVVQLFRRRGVSLTPLLDQAWVFRTLPDVQVALVASGRLGRTTIAEFAAYGFCPDALFALLHRKGHADISAMLKATQLLEPLTPEERAALLRDLLAKASTPGAEYVAAR